MSTDLGATEVVAALGRRPVRAYPALLSTEADAMAWARAGGRAGAVVVADYQASPRGRGGWPWRVQPGRGLGFSLVLRPDLPPEREGWLYVAGSLALGSVLAVPDAAYTWPDTVHAGGDDATVARIGIYAQLGAQRLDWAVVTVLVDDVLPPRAPLLARLVDAIEQRVAAPPDAVLAAYLPRCVTLGRRVRARLIPLGPGGPEVTGEAVDVLADGALVLRTARDRRVAVPPPNLGRLEPAAEPPRSGD